MAGLERLRADKADALAEASRALADATRATTLADTERAGEQVRDALTEAIRITRILKSEGEIE